MFRSSAKLYDAFYRAQRKDYVTESTKVAEIITARAPDARTLLDVGCGTGAHIEHLRKQFACTGVDLERELLAIAHERLGPEIALHQADMVDFDLEQRYDAVICLFSAIGYVVTKERLAMAAKAFARHVNPGGVVIVEPWITPEAWRPDGSAHLTVVDEPGLQAVRMGKSRRQGQVTTLNMHYLVASADAIDHSVECHELGLFSFDEYAAAFADAGFAIEIDQEGLIGRGLIICESNGRP